MQEGISLAQPLDMTVHAKQHTQQRMTCSQRMESYINITEICSGFETCPSKITARILCNHPETSSCLLSCRQRAFAIQYAHCSQVRYRLPTMAQGAVMVLFLNRITVEC